MMIYKADLKGTFFWKAPSTVDVETTLEKFIIVSPCLVFRPYFDHQKPSGDHHTTYYGKFNMICYVRIDTLHVDQVEDLMRLGASAIDAPFHKVITLLRNLEDELHIHIFTNALDIHWPEMVPASLIQADCL